MTNTVKMKYGEILELMESVEHGMKLYYEGLTEKFDQPDLQRLWVMMAEQEETHTRLVRLMRKRSMDDEDLQNTDMDVPAYDINRIKQFLEEYQDILAREDLTLKEGFQVAITLESLELTPIYKPFIIRQDKPTRDVLDELLDSEDMHLSLLVKAVRRHIKDPEFLEYAERVLRDNVGEVS
jgi:rubrerythrin